MTQIVKVTKPKVTGLKGREKRVSKKFVYDPWNPPELVGMSKGEVHDYFEHLGCRAAREGKKMLKDAHGAWLHGWIMEMENTGKLEHLKVEDIDTEPFLFRKRNKQEMADYDEGFEAGSDSKESDGDKSFAWQRGWAEAQNSFGLTTWNSRNNWGREHHRGLSLSTPIKGSSGACVGSDRMTRWKQEVSRRCFHLILHHRSQEASWGIYGVRGTSRNAQYIQQTNRLRDRNFRVCSGISHVQARGIFGCNSETNRDKPRRFAHFRSQKRGLEPLVAEWRSLPCEIDIEISLNCRCLRGWARCSLHSSQLLASQGAWRWDTRAAEDGSFGQVLSDFS